MPPDPVVLDYSQPPPRNWRRIVKWTVRVALLAGLSAGLVWTSRTAWQAWQRYRYQQDWLAASETLTHTVLAPDKVIIDPASGPVTYMQPYDTFANGRGLVRTLTIGTDPSREAQLRLMRRFGGLEAFPFASNLQTGHGRSFILASIEVWDVTNGSPVMQVAVQDESMQPGVFPFYRYTTHAYGTNLSIRSSTGRTLPTVLIGQIDPGGSSWTLPMRVGGKPEWVRFDHAGPTWPTVTASFGQLNQSGSNCKLTY